MGSRVLLYREVQQKLTQSLAAGEWKPGSMLPSEPKLAKRYNVGISTIRAAVRELELLNLLTRAQGKGTFVSLFEERKRSHRFLNIVRQDGTRETTHRRLISLERIEAPDDVADLLQLPHVGRGRQVFKLVTILTFGQANIDYSNIFVPAALFPRLRASLIPDGSESLYSLYQTHFNISVTKVVDSLSAAPASQMVAKLTGVDVGSPVLYLQRLAFGYDGTRVEVRRNWFKTDQHVYRIEQGSTG